MGTYISFISKPSCEDQINDAYAKLTGKKNDFLVYSKKVIESEIAFIHSEKGSAQAHLRQCLKKPKDWDRLFPVYRSGTGQIKISGIEENDHDRINSTIRDIKFILENRMLFSKIEGLDDAREYGFTDFKGDIIENNTAKNNKPIPEIAFNSLPIGNSNFYKLCVEYDRPDIWNAYLSFKNEPTDSTWKSLREKVIPWNGVMSGFWAIVENLATERDGQDFGLMGRFRDGNLPSLILVRAALEIKS